MCVVAVWTLGNFYRERKPSSIPLIDQRRRKRAAQDVSVQSDPTTRHRHHARGARQLLRQQDAGDPRLSRQVAGATATGPEHGEGSHPADC